MIHRFRRQSIVALVIAAACAGRCQWPQTWPPTRPADGGVHEGAAPVPAPTSDRPSFDNTRGDDGNTTVVGIAFDVVRVNMPAEGVRDALKIWNHVDEMRIDGDTAARLARNGVRLGAATRDAWPAMMAIVEAGKGTVQHERLTPPEGLPLAIQFGTIDEAEEMFSYTAAGRLRGKTFDQGDKVLTVEYWFRPELGGTLDLATGFEIRADMGELTWERRDGIIRQVPSVQRSAFDELQAALTLQPEEFLVMGLSREADNEYLVGSRFFMSLPQGKRVESFYCITPQLFQAPNDP